MRQDLKTRNYNTEQNNLFASEQHHQELEYNFPYHHLPDYYRGKIMITRFWPWAIPYLGRIKLIVDFLSNCQFSSLVDIGCGDGKLINVLYRHFNHATLRGIDYFEKSIQLAKCLNPAKEGVHFDVYDATEYSAYIETFDIATMLEVLEHIHPDKVEAFLENSLASIKPGGHLLLTVPSNNLAVRKKHYQHFSVKQLEKIFKNHPIDVINMEYIDSTSLIMGLFNRVLCNSLFVLNNKKAINLIFRHYVKYHLHADEAAGQGIFLIGRKK